MTSRTEFEPMSTTPIGSSPALRSKSSLSRFTLASAFRRLERTRLGWTRLRPREPANPVVHKCRGLAQQIERALVRSLVLRSKTEPAREAVLQRLPAAREARIGHEVLMRVERLF